MGQVYFIEDREARAIKVGWTSRDPAKRLRVLQTGCPRPLALMGSVEGSKGDEKALHDRLRAYRLRGEWFSDCPEVRAQIGLTLACKAVAILSDDSPEPWPEMGALPCE